MESNSQVADKNLNTMPSYIVDDENAVTSIFDDVHAHHCGSRFVFGRSSKFRIFWTAVITVLLIYTGTVFLFRMCFVTFRIHLPGDGEHHHEQEDSGWDTFDTFVTITFWVDLFVNFFFSYQDFHGDDVDDLRLIAMHYLKTHFIINFIACIPEDLIQAVVSSAAGDADVSQVNQGLRILRLERMSRLSRLFRVARLGKLKSESKSHLFQIFQKMKGVRLVNLTCGLAFLVHILACGWYLCAALHDDVEDTWVARRMVSADAEGNFISLIERGPVDQWMNSMYFILTVFTTVGFGDMSAVTTGEIIYVCVTMGIGAVIHSIIISEAINVVTSSDKTHEIITKQRALIEAFASHTMLKHVEEDKLKNWVESSAHTWAAQKYDRDSMRELLTDPSMPHSILSNLPPSLFNGQLIKNKFVRICEGQSVVPPRLPMLLAASLNRFEFKGLEVVYQAQDYAFNLCLVLEGTFAYVAKPTERGGVMHIPKVQAQDTPDIGPGMSKTGSGGGFFKELRGTFGQRHAPSMEEQEIDVKHEDQILRPYLLFGPGTYFGDIEMAKNYPRRSSARCESRTGSLLTLGKAEFKHIQEEFPQYAILWLRQADRRETHRRFKQTKLTKPFTYKYFAAATIQRWYREEILAVRNGVQTKSAVKMMERQGHRNGQRRDPNLPAAGPSTVELQEAQGKLEENVNELRNDVKQMGRHIAEVNRKLDALLSVALGDRQDSQFFGI